MADRFAELDLGIRRAVVDALLQITVHKRRKKVRQDPIERVEIRSRATGEVVDLTWKSVRFVPESPG